MLAQTFASLIHALIHSRKCHCMQKLTTVSLCKYSATFCDCIAMSAPAYSQSALAPLSCVCLRTQGRMDKCTPVWPWPVPSRMSRRCVWMGPSGYTSTAIVDVHACRLDLDKGLQQHVYLITYQALSCREMLAHCLPLLLQRACGVLSGKKCLHYQCGETGRSVASPVCGASPSGHAGK